MNDGTQKKVKNTKHMPLPPLGEEVNYRQSWRIFRIMAELVDGYQLMGQFDNEVTIFGSARLKEGTEYYAKAKELGRLLGMHGNEVITGGGPGIMEAANRGAHEAGGVSIGLNIQLPFEQLANSYVNRSLGFYYFFTRKVMLSSPANAFVYFPGGFGTLDEFFEVADHMELGKMCEVPIILFGSEFWNPLLDALKKSALHLGIITKEETKMWHVVDEPEAAMKIIEEGMGQKGYCELSSSNFHSKANLDWRIFRVMAELVEGFEFLTGLGEDVSVLGTKSIAPESPYYASAYRLGGMLAERGYATITGGGKGIAEAANKGAFENGGESIGVGMEVHGEGKLNSYLTKSMIFSFPYTRKLILTAPSKAFVFYPGGLGTLHQLFEVLTLIQTKKIAAIPVILYDHAFWSPLHEFIQEVQDKAFHTVAPQDNTLYQIVDTEEEILAIIEASTVRSTDLSNTLGKA